MKDANASAPAAPAARPVARRSRSPRINDFFQDADVQLSPANERFMVRALTRKIYNERYRFKRILEGNQIADAYTPEQRREYWRRYIATHREERNARAREFYRQRRLLEGAISILRKRSRGSMKGETIVAMKRSAGAKKRVDVQAAAQFLSEHAGSRSPQPRYSSGRDAGECHASRPWEHSFSTPTS